MAKVLTSGVTLRKSNAFGDIHFFQAGETLPDWAEDMVGEHLFQEQAGETPTPQPERNLPSGEQRPVQAPEKLAVPRKNGSQADWIEFARELKVKVTEEMSRDEIVEKVEDEHPELFE